jgi:putative oxidoreductase
MVRPLQPPEGTMSNNLVLLIARILLSFMFIMAGAQKFTDIAGTAGYIGSVGLPAGTLLAVLAGALEVLAGLAVLVGFQTRIASWLLAAFCVVAGVMFHYVPGNMTEMITMMKDLTIAGGFLALSVAGAGGWSVDARRG